MSEIITAPYRSVQTITAEIMGIATQTAQVLFISACEMGKRMLEAKELVNHGEWGSYLEDLCKQLGIGKSTAHNWMKLYRECGDSPNFQALGNITYTKAVRLLALPEETREEILQENNVEDMSSRELEQAIKDKKAAQGMLAIAQETNSDLKRRNDELERESAALKSSLEHAKSAEATAKAELQQLREHPEIPPSLMAKTVDDAKAQAMADAQSAIKAAQADAAEKEEARANMEAALTDAQKQIKELTAASQLSGQDAASFRVLFDQIPPLFNQMMGYLLKVEQSDPELGRKLRFAAQRMGEKFAEAAGEKVKE